MCLWGGGGLHCYHHFPELKFLCVLGGGGRLHFYRTFTWMCSNVGLRHDMPNQTSDFRLYTHSWSAITAGVGLGSLLNPTSLTLRPVAKQLKYNGNPRRWPQFQREFKLWVKTQKLHEDQFLTALLDCLEGPPADTWLRTWSDRKETSSPLTFDEVWEQLEVRGSRLLEDHYHRMLKNFPLFSRLMLHEVQDKKQRF